jgi:hypothetical protein
MGVRSRLGPAFRLSPSEFRPSGRSRLIGGLLKVLLRPPDGFKSVDLIEESGRRRLDRTELVTMEMRVDIF